LRRPGDKEEEAEAEVEEGEAISAAVDYAASLTFREGERRHWRR
jgi:hypothetical protein